MALVTRLILALALVVQSMPGLAVERCAEMTRVAGSGSGQPAMAAEDACPCCSGRSRDGSGTTCTNSDGVSVCKCGMPRSEQPVTPPSDSKTGQVQFAVAILTTFPGVTFAEAGAPSLPARSLGAAPRRSANSVQSVLCVWIV